MPTNNQLIDILLRSKGFKRKGEIKSRDNGDVRGLLINAGPYVAAVSNRGYHARRVLPARRDEAIAEASLFLDTRALIAYLAGRVESLLVFGDPDYTMTGLI